MSVGEKAPAAASGVAAAQSSAAGHLFAGAPDGRQSALVNEPVSRFRPRYRALNHAEIELHDELKAAFANVERLIDRTPEGRYRSLAMTELELACMWAVKGLTG